MEAHRGETFGLGKQTRYTGIPNRHGFTQLCIHPILSHTTQGRTFHISTFKITSSFGQNMLNSGAKNGCQIAGYQRKSAEFFHPLAGLVIGVLDILSWIHYSWSHHS